MKKPTASATTTPVDLAPPASVETRAPGRPVIQTWMLAFLTLVCATFVLYMLRGVLLPLIIALLVSLGFKPMVRALTARRVPVAISLVLVFLAVVAIFAGLSTILINGVNSFAEASPVYEEKLVRWLGTGSTWIRDVMGRFGLEKYALQPADAVNLPAVARFIAGSLGGILSATGDLILASLYLIFLLMGSQTFPAKLKAAFRPEISSRVGAALESIDANIRRYLAAKTLISLVTSVIVTIILLAFGVDFALFLGLLTFVLNFIPNIGSFIATMFPALVSLLQFESFGLALIITALLVVVQNIMGNIVEPQLMGTRLDLSPLAILLSLIFWGWLWGLWGMILAVPIMSLIKITCENVEQLRPIAVLLGSGPPDPQQR
jgi:AI-2 transport protein TqsA